MPWGKIEEHARMGKALMDGDLCIKNDEFCIRNDEYLIKNCEFCI